MAMQCSILNIFIILCLCSIIMARPKSGQHFQRQDEFSFEDPSLIDIDEIYKDLRYIPSEADQNDLTNWPWLNELIPNENEKNIDYSNLYRDKYYDRLIQPSLYNHEIPETLPTPLAYNYKTEKPRTNNAVKDHSEKKNNYYMSLCHFKICNMGRKRNTRYLHLGSENQGAM